MSTADHTVRPATRERWEDVVTVMGTRGDPSRCWCQYFRLRGRAWTDSAAPENRRALRTQVEAGPPPGVIAYLDGEPVGWCAVGPTAGYPRLAASPPSADGVPGAWAVSCFVVRVGHRRLGVARSLLTGAVDLAREHGAPCVEAYPVDVAARRSVSSAELFRGTLSLFRAAGFAEVTRPSPARVVVRLEL